MDEKSNPGGRGGSRPGAGRPAEKAVRIGGKLMRPVDVVRAIALSDAVPPSVRLRAAEAWKAALAAGEPEPLEIPTEAGWEWTGAEATPAQWEAWRAYREAREAWMRAA